MDQTIVNFEAQRSRLRGLAYRMLGSVADAEDVVQDCWLRWQAAAARSVVDVDAYLMRITTNLCLDKLKSAQSRREQYIGEWLPEPVLTELEAYAPGPEHVNELADDLSFALLKTLDALSPLERAAFLLHDIFEVDFDSIASTLQRDSAACRQLASRARTQVRAARPRFTVSNEAGARLAQAFVLAVGSGDLQQLTQLLAQDVGFYSDGGGKVAATRHPVFGHERVAKALIGFTKSRALGNLQFASRAINGMPGLYIAQGDGTPVQTIAFALDGAERIAAIYVQRNPDKLKHLAQ